MITGHIFTESQCQEYKGQAIVSHLPDGRVRLVFTNTDNEYRAALSHKFMMWMPRDSVRIQNKMWIKTKRGLVLTYKVI